MFSTLRSRLWLSYALLIVVALCLVWGGFFIALARSQVQYRQANTELRVAEAVLVTRLEQAPDLSKDNLKTLAKRMDEKLGVRLLFVQVDGQLIFDTRAAQSKLKVPALFTKLNPYQVHLVRDGARWWVYTIRRITPEIYLLVLTPRPAFALRTLLRDELLGPLFQAGLAALLISFILALAVSRWVSAPLQKMAVTAGKVAAGEARPIPLEGPAEVKELAASFNRMSKQVQTSQQSQREFVANVSHELKTPLTSIQGFAQAIVDGAVTSPEAVQSAGKIILDESARMYRLVLDLLALSRLETGTADLRREPVALADLLQSLVVRFTPQAEKVQVSLEMELGDLPALQGDGDSLAQVFSNLIDNGIKFSPAGGRVLVTAIQAGSRVEVRVTDTGPGVAPQDRERIFERFYQVDRSRPGGGHRGVGLGLAIAKEIVLAHHGSITVESQPGKGSTFIVNLPL